MSETKADTELSRKAAQALIAMERRQRFSWGRVLALMIVLGVIAILIAGAL